jgi:sterile alpha motif and leucine zipper-containing kinase AZK
MAPEVLKGEKYETNADIFSYGMILWEILSREIPYYGINPYQVISLVADKKQIVQVPTEGNQALRRIIAKCLEYDSNKRPKLDEIVDYLQNLRNYVKGYDLKLQELYEYLN